MKELLEITKTSRNMVSKLIQGYTLEQLNKVPAGFNNNLIWNVGHIVVTQQLLVYKLAGLPMMISDEFVKKYMKGTKTEHQATQEEVDEILSLLHATVEQTAKDIDNNLFQNFTEYPTSTGFVLKSNADSMEFNNFHEGLHIGVIMAIRKLV
ncbi:DinB family protein [Flavobacterium nitratireducens]|uniref:DinB family protein n=1 Tax=Flavobacterium nitratireducens TaxID=992289 RepID=UPI0024158666|nr:DinB family protein [Flavobacterium nitratireducens]